MLEKEGDLGFSFAGSLVRFVYIMSLAKRSICIAGSPGSQERHHWLDFEDFGVMLW